jgi:hypothetical protein
MMPLETLSATTLAVINCSTGELVITGKDTVAMRTRVFVADEPDEKLRMAFTMLPLTGLPTVNAKAPVGQPEPFAMVGGPNTALL